MYHDISLKELYHALSTSEKGLSSSEAAKRLAHYGKNEIKEKERISPLKILLNQFMSPVVWILIAAILISLAVNHRIDATVIAIILLINAVFGFFQEYKAERAIEALKKLTSLKAVVIRDNREIEVDASELVPGDVILLETGDKIPADARLIEAISLATQEASLTGESVPVSKNIGALSKITPVADRKNMVYSGTIITRGRGKAAVTETGLKTQIGRIAKMIETEKKALTPLQRQLKVFAKSLSFLVVGVIIIIFAVGILKGENLFQMFLTAISLAVAAIPEGLPAVVTISLALGIRRMVRRNALIRKLPSVETLGCTTVICSDKTGTLTKNEMTVKKIYVDNTIVDITGIGYERKGSFSSKPKNLRLLLEIGTLCNDAKIDQKIFGDPTEAALIISAAKAGIDKEEFELKYKRIEEIPFESERKRMTTVNLVKGQKIAFTKGAPDVILHLCSKINVNGKITKLDEKQKKEILKVNEQFAGNALRVLGFAYRPVKKDVEEKELIFVGLQAMIDPPRDEVKESIRKCERAGIRVVMITGDHKLTAMAIAHELGLKGESITGQDLDKMSDEGLKKSVDEISVYARVNPEHKLRIVKALESKGHVVAVTGDGVNDAPALKKSDIGIAMGIKGTDVAKEASDMILTDDNFASIVNSVEEGRTIYDNIRKFVQYLLSSNFGEVLTIFIAIMIFMDLHGKPILPLLPLQILWINIVTDMFPALALGIDPGDKGIMERPPRKAGTHIVNIDRASLMFFIAITMMLGTLGIFKYYMIRHDIIYAQAMAFTTLVMFQLFNVFNCRSERKSALKGFFSNKWLIAGVAVSILLQLMVIYTPLSRYFICGETACSVPVLTLVDWFYIIIISSSVLIFIELIKLFQNVFKVKL